MSAPYATPTLDIRVGGCVAATVQERPDGALLLRSTEALQPYHRRWTDALEHWAQVDPDRPFVARRGADGSWVALSYAQMVGRARCIGAALLARGLGLERPVAILSGNDLEHLSLVLGALWVGVPVAPISPAYATVAQDFSKLRHILGLATPGLVFAADGGAFARALTEAVAPDCEVVLAQGLSHPGLNSRAATPFDALLSTTPSAESEAAHAAVDGDTIAKLLFTSGSTKQPKGVVNTHRMLCANQQMIRQCFAFLQDEPPVLVDWLPWNHTFGGNHNVGIVMTNGGTLYIDDGKPTPGGMAETLRNLREIAPTIYFNVPKGFEEIVSAMAQDTALRDTLFSRVKAFMFAGAGLSQAVWDQLDAHAVAAIGARVRMLTGLGMTETAPSCTFAVGPTVRAGEIGLPVPGVEVKLVPNAGKLEIRFRGPNVMPGYWRDAEQTAAAFDDEGFYCTGDAVLPVDPAQPARGLLFDGRIAEDFKLSSGTFVSVGPLRARVIAAGHPLVVDAVATAINRDDLGLLVFPRMDEARQLAGLPREASADDVLSAPAVVAFFQATLDRLWHEGTGSATRPARLHVLREPPSIDRGEVTDKGSINQRAVLSHRAALVEHLYSTPAADSKHAALDVLRPQR